MEGKKVIFIENEKEPENADEAHVHLEEVGDFDYKESFYEKHIKCVIVNPGLILFKQKAVGKNKEYFKLYKLRSMKISTQHDTSIHMLENPEQYITQMGNFLREHSLDELL